MNNLSNSLPLVFRRASTSPIDEPQNSSFTMKRTLKRASFGSRQSPSSPRTMNNSELASVVDEQLMQIRQKLAEFREQDTHFRERIDSLTGSVSEIASRSSQSSFTPSECSDLDSLDEFSEEEEEIEQTVGQKAFSKQPPPLLRIPTIKVIDVGNRSTNCFHMRQSSDPSSLHNHIELPKEEVMETRRHSSYSADQVYPQYDNPEEIRTLL